MEINPRNFAPYLVESNIVEPLKARTADRFYLVIRHQEMLFPPHEDRFPARVVGKVDVAAFDRFLER